MFYWGWAISPPVIASDGFYDIMATWNNSFTFILIIYTKKAYYFLYVYILGDWCYGLVWLVGMVRMITGQSGADRRSSRCKLIV